MSKLIRVSEEAHKAAKVGAAWAGISLEDWASLALIAKERAQGGPPYEAKQAEAPK